MSLGGHDESWRNWRAALAGERIHHGWILAGRRGLGKASFAFAASHELVGGGLDPSAHPDILHIHPLADGEDEERKRAEGKAFKSKRSISVDQVRSLQRRLTTRPTLGQWRTVIVDAADDLEKSAFNALLKSLEEPPAGTIFLLVSHRPGRLPATIRSRCRVMRFPDLADEAIGDVLDREAPGLAPEARAAALRAANGSPGAALAFARRDLATVSAIMERIVATGDADLALRGSLLAAIGAKPDRDRLFAALEAARLIIVRAATGADRRRAGRIIDAHAGLSALLSQAPTANFDPASLVLEIGGLLASAAPDREAA